MNNHTMKLLILVLLFSVAQRQVAVEPWSLTGGLRPIRATEYRVIADNNTSLRRRLAPYKMCLQCKCCAANTTCVTTPCCFGIDCQLPNKPFGVCAFVPMTCNCTSCAS